MNCPVCGRVCLLLLLRGELSSCCELMWGASEPCPPLCLSHHVLGFLTFLLGGGWTYLSPPPLLPQNTGTPGHPSSSRCPHLACLFITLEPSRSSLHTRTLCLRPSPTSPLCLGPPLLPVSPATLHALVIFISFYFLVFSSHPSPPEPVILHCSCCTPRYGTCEEASGPLPPPQNLLIGNIRSQSLCSSPSLLGPSVLSVSLSVCSFPCPSPQGSIC